MSNAFLHLVNVSVTAGWAVLIVLLLRLIFKKAPAWSHCLLWGIVALRLILPFSIESVFSLIPSADPLPHNITVTQTPAVNSGFESIDQTINPVLQEHLSPAVGESVNPMQVVMGVAANLWILGLAAMLVYGLVSYLRLHHKVRPSLCLQDTVYCCDHIPTPFVLGVFRPRIYLPSDLSEEQRPFVVAHEQAHLRRLDHLWKPSGFILLSVYWFNPLLWVAYVLFCRDVEKACDQRVIRDMDASERRQYSEALVACSTHHRSAVACPLAFGEVGVKTRVKSVLYYKKPAFWLIIVAVVVGAVAAVCLLTDPLGTRDSTIRKIANQKGYDIVAQVPCKITLSFPTSALPDSIDPQKGHEFDKEKVVAYRDNHATIYLKKIQYANEGSDQVYLCFDCTYRDLPRDSGTVIYPLDMLENGLGDAVYIEDNTVRDDVTSYPDAVNERGQGPYEQIWFYLSTDVLEKASGKIEFDVYLNRITYVKESGETTTGVWHDSDTESDFHGTSETTNIPFVDNHYEVVYSRASFDVDGDGKIEHCSIGVGLASGRSSYTFYAREDGSEVNEYKQTIYTPEQMDVSFHICNDGTVQLQGLTQNKEHRLYDIGFSNGYITLTEAEPMKAFSPMPFTLLEGTIGSTYKLDQFKLTSILIAIIDSPAPSDGYLSISGQYVENGERKEWRKTFSVPYGAFMYLYDADHPYIVYNTTPTEWYPTVVDTLHPDVVGYIFNLIFE